MIRILVRVVVVVLALAAGISAGFGYEHNQLQNERKLNQAKLNEENKKFAVIQKKYIEEKALSSNLEAQKRAVQEETDKIRKDNEALEANLKELKAAVEASEEQKKGTVEMISRFKAEMEEAAKRYAEAVQAVRDREAEIKRLSAEGQVLQAELKKHKEGLERCEGNNARLCIIADDILQKYEKKGVMSTIVQNEPFTQIKKVEIEKYVQEYSQLIDQEKLKKRDKNDK